MGIARTEIERGRSRDDARGGAQQGILEWSAGVSAAERKASRRQRRPSDRCCGRTRVRRASGQSRGTMINGLPSSGAISAEDGHLWGEDRIKRSPALATSAFFLLPLRKCRAYDTQQRKKRRPHGPRKEPRDSGRKQRTVSTALRVATGGTPSIHPRPAPPARSSKFAGGGPFTLSITDS